MPSQTSWWTTAEAAAAWGVSRQRVLRLLAQGRIPGAVKWGRDWQIPADAPIRASRRTPAILPMEEQP